jgi:hypothetical protein
MAAELTEQAPRLQIQPIKQFADLQRSLAKVLLQEPV